MPFPIDNPFDGRGAMPAAPPRRPAGIECAPTWLGLLPALLTITRDAETPEARQTGMREMQRMARLADAAAQLALALRPQLTPQARRVVEEASNAERVCGSRDVAAALDFLLSRQDAAKAALASVEAR